MRRSDLQSYTIPDESGVYFFLNKQKQILYIGKATSLRSRVKSYFTKDVVEKRSLLVAQMVEEACFVEWTVTDSVLEALIIETNLIRTHKPKYNTRSKDDKSYNHLIITKETWPRVLVMRGKDLTEQFRARDIAYHFGPFPNGQQLREALKIVRKIFQFYDTSSPVGEERSKIKRGQIDFNRQIGLYPDATDRTAYLRTIKHLALFFSAKKATLITDLERQMKRAAKTLRFEDAAMYKKQLFALQHIEDIALIKRERVDTLTQSAYRIEAYDVAHLGGKSMVGVLTVVQNGEPQPAQYRKFKVVSVSGPNDPAALREILQRRLGHQEWPYPQLIVVDGNQVQKRQAELVLHAAGLLIPVVAVTKNRQHKPEKILGARKLVNHHETSIILANAEAHRFSIAYHRHTQRKRALR